MTTPGQESFQGEQAELGAETIGRLRDAYAAFARGDIEGLIADLHPEVEFHNPDYAVEPGVRHGRAGFRKALEALQDLFEYESVELTDIIPVGEQVIVVMHMRGMAKTSGVPLDSTFAHLWTVRDGRGVRVQWFRSVEEAQAAATGGPSRGNVETVRRIYAVFDGDLEALLALLDPEVEYVNPEDAIEPGTRRGHEGIRAVFKHLDEVFAEYRHEPHDFVEVGDQVVVPLTFSARGRQSGAELRHEEAHLWSVRDGLGLRVEWFRDLSAALEAAGRPSPAP
jgi:uncharacterized protein